MRANRFIKNMVKDRVLTMRMDGTPDKCTVCGAWIGPKDENFGTSICKTCEAGGESQDENLEEWHEYLMRTYNQEEEELKNVKG